MSAFCGSLNDEVGQCLMHERKSSDENKMQNNIYGMPRFLELSICVHAEKEGKMFFYNPAVV